MGNGPHDLLAGIYRPLLERFEAAAKDPVAAQEARLRSLLAANATSEYGRRHGFASIGSMKEFRAHVPRVEFDDIAAEVARIADGEQGILTTEPVQRFVKTSGTTGPSKRIPITASLAAEVRDAQLVWLIHLLRESPRHANGAKLALVSPEDGELTPGGLPVGANTGRMQRALPWFVRVQTKPPREVLAVKNPEVRAFLVALAAAGTDVGSLTTANPSTVWMLAKRLRAWAEPLADALARGGIPDRCADGTPIPGGVQYVLSRFFPRRRARAAALRSAAAGNGALFPALWPRLTTVNCWRGGPAKFWLDLLAPELGGLPVRDPGISASEGFFAVPLESGTAAGVLLSNGPVFELDPVGGGETVPIDRVETGAEYELFITTCGGLWRYAMRDVLKVVGFHHRAPLVEFVRKAGNVLSITGEKVTESHVLAAAAHAAERCGYVLSGAGATVVKADPPHYLALLEVERARDEQRARREETDLAEAFDRALGEANVEYEGKRADGRLGPARVKVVADGSFERLRRARLAAGAPEAQVKIPALFPDGDPF